MRLFADISDRYRRWRHSKGYGIHSPLAYAIVTEALFPRLGYAYYAENDPALEGADPGISRMARKIYRVALYMRSSFRHGERNGLIRFYLPSSSPSCFFNALRLAGVEIIRDPSAADCLILPAAEAEDGEIGGTFGPQGILTLRGRGYSWIFPHRLMADTTYLLP